MRTKNLLLKRLSKIFALTILVSSCNLNVEDLSYQSTNNGSWEKDEPMVFPIQITDTIHSFDWYIHLRNNQDYPYSNLYVIAVLSAPDGLIQKDTLEFQMAYPDGNWTGKTSGSLVENKWLYKENVSLPNTGTYTLTIAHAMRNLGVVESLYKLKGVTDVGYSIEKHN